MNIKSPYVYFLHRILLLVVLFMMPGCVGLPKIETAIHESPRGMVALKVIPERQAKTSHPITMDRKTLQTFLRGVYVQEEKALLESLITEDVGLIRVFTEEDIDFLLPYLHKALSQATVEEEIIFELIYNRPGGRTITIGSLFVQDGNLHLTVNNFQSNPGKASLRMRSSYGQFRPKIWSLTYRPEAHLAKGSLNPTKKKGLPNTIVLRLKALEESSERDTSSTMDGTSQTTNKNRESIRQEIQQLRESIHNQEQQLKQLEQRLEP